MEPLFPKIHVKDAIKGGPKPPSRNKMALYDEAIRSLNNRLPNESTNITAFHPNDHPGGHVGNLGKRVIYPFYRSSSSTHTTPTITSCPCDETSVKTSTHSAQTPVGFMTSKNSMISSRCKSFQQKNNISLDERCSSNDQDELEIGKITNSGHNTLKRARVYDQDLDIQAKMSWANIAQSLSQEKSKSLASVLQKKMRLASVVDDRENVLSNESSKSLSNNKVSESSKNTPIFSCHNGNRADEDSIRPNTSVEENNKELKDSTIEKPKVLGHGVLKSGHKNFWETRTILLSQQRIFSFQLFELHRLVKVQRSFARSPRNMEILQVPPPPSDSFTLSRRSLPSSRVQPNNKNMNPCLLYDSENNKPSSTDLCLNTYSFPTAQLPSINQPQTKTCVMNSRENMLPPYLHSPLQNHLFVSVMSSEGLVYKPMKVPSSGNPNTLNAPTYGVPVALSYPDLTSPSHVTLRSTSDANLQGSMVSSSVVSDPPKALPLFPMEPGLTQNMDPFIPTFENGGYVKETLAIKPIPHSRRLTNISSMRIFRSIEEE